MNVNFLDIPVSKTSHINADRIKITSIKEIIWLNNERLGNVTVSQCSGEAFNAVSQKFIHQNLNTHH